MTTKHTPGPWAVSDVGEVVVCATGRTLCDVYSSPADNGELAEYDALKDLILTLLPYALDDGEDPPTEANAEECVEYAADEIKRLRASASFMRAEVDRLYRALAYARDTVHDVAYLGDADYLYDRLEEALKGRK